MSRAADPTAAFLTALRGSRLLTDAQFADLAGWAEAAPDVPAVAKEINRRGWLTPYQIKEVFKGRGGDLTLGTYVLLDLLGEGGMGKVYKAHHNRLGRDVALKVIRKEKLAHPAAEARFAQEVRALGQMSHPNVVTVYDADQANGTHYYAMEYIDGTDLTKLVLARGPLPVPEACEYIRQAALGLHHAFESSLVHRDIKPSNILVSRNGKMVKVVDLGLARLLDDDLAGPDAHRITQEGFVIGTPDFLAPEQARDPGDVDIRADIYALGGTLYYLLTGKVPFDGSNPTEKLLKHCTQPPPSLLARRPDAPPQVEQIIHWCMAKRREDRPQTPLQLAQVLQPFCPPPAAPSGGYVPPHGSGPHTPIATAQPAYARPAPAPAPLPMPVPEAERSSQLFRLPPQDNATDPIRRRAEKQFPLALVLVGVAVVVLAGILAYAGYRTLDQTAPPPTPGPFSNSLGMGMVVIEGGTFRVGTADGTPGYHPEEGPAHDATVRGPFLVSACEVAQGQYLKVTGTNPSRSSRATNSTNFPVENVTWDDATDFCRKLTEKEKGEKWTKPGWAYRLPTEAEWEYACRAGTTGPFAFGNRLTLKQGLYNPAAGDEFGDDTPDRKIDMPQDAGKGEANAWGVHDAHGNVAEWCADYFDHRYPSADPADNPRGPAEGDKRVVRGGSFRDPAALCRSATRRGVRPLFRGGGPADPQNGTIGFRVVYAPSVK